MSSSKEKFERFHNKLASMPAEEVRERLDRQLEASRAAILLRPETGLFSACLDRLVLLAIADHGLRRPETGKQLAPDPESISVLHQLQRICPEEETSKNLTQMSVALARSVSARVKPEGNYEDPAFAAGVVSGEIVLKELPSAQPSSDMN